MSGLLLTFNGEKSLMNDSLNKTNQVNVNVMEFLVQEEIDKQLEFYPEKIRPYLNRVEIATYALNRLPSLYASSVIGKEQQKRIGRQQYKKQIPLAVRRALAAIERDPLRKSTPLISKTAVEHKMANLALSKLQKFLYERQLLSRNQTLSWNNLTFVVQEILNIGEGRRSD